MAGFSSFLARVCDITDYVRQAGEGPADVARALPPVLLAVAIPIRPVPCPGPAVTAPSAATHHLTVHVDTRHGPLLARRIATPGLTALTKTTLGTQLFAKLEWLLWRDYAAARRRLIDPQRASLDRRAGQLTPPAIPAATEPSAHRHDTTHLDAIDAGGLMIAATPSGGWIPSSPVIAGLGFPLGTRGQMFWLDPEHPNSLQPRKRPRTTLSPSLVTRDGAPHMVFGTPGGDMQDQWTLQFFLSVVDHGLDLQAAVDAATFHTNHVPSSFYPREAHPGSLTVEGRIPPDVRAPQRYEPPVLSGSSSPWPKWAKLSGPPGPYLNQT